MKQLNFESKVAYKKWLAYGHMHTKEGLLVKKKKGRKSLFEATSGNTAIKIKGKTHRVSHKR